MTPSPTPAGSHSRPIAFARAVDWGRTGIEPGDVDFAFISDALREMGGLRTADEFAADLRALSRAGVGEVARWIVRRQVLNIYWRGTYWIPDFQFVQATVQLRQTVSAVLQELVPVLNDWDLCLWFATSSEWLDGLSPAQAMASDAGEVFHAARTHRFVLVG